MKRIDPGKVEYCPPAAKVRTQARFSTTESTVMKSIKSATPVANKITFLGIYFL
jgi:hypothetical protein